MFRKIEVFIVLVLAGRAHSYGEYGTYCSPQDTQPVDHCHPRELLHCIDNMCRCNSTMAYISRFDAYGGRCVLKVGELCVLSESDIYCYQHSVCQVANSVSILPLSLATLATTRAISVTKSWILSARVESTADVTTVWMKVLPVSVSPPTDSSAVMGRQQREKRVTLICNVIRKENANATGLKVGFGSGVQIRTRKEARV
ncbi:hypothetical protein Fcan01_15297 [Folsomia candida]|uniref:Secreted protein n=1 Tax=Folsomia candida TaxID=158441 RepID=A0A226DZ30_FOLCA|nr:hypothetical protein Fcan01_15297 [Folsomia candida]